VGRQETNKRLTPKSFIADMLQYASSGVTSFLSSLPNWKIPSSEENRVRPSHFGFSGDVLWGVSAFNLSVAGLLFLAGILSFVTVSMCLKIARRRAVVGKAVCGSGGHKVIRATFHSIEYFSHDCVRKSLRMRMASIFRSIFGDLWTPILPRYLDYSAF
jgi:hypothetical protein